MSVELKILDEEEETSKEVHVVNYLKSILAIEQAMDPYKEQKKELRKDRVERLVCGLSLNLPLS